MLFINLRKKANIAYLALECVKCRRKMIYYDIFFWC